MRIVVDVSPLALPRTGIGNYLRGMLAGLAEVAGPEHEVVAFSVTGAPGRRRIGTALEGLPVGRRLLVVPYARGLRPVWSRLGRPRAEALTGRLDVFHFSDWMFPAQGAGLRATTIHDLVPLRFPEWVAPGTRRLHAAKYEHTARSRSLVIANSKFTAADVVERLGVPAERVRVAYPGIDPIFRADGPRAERARPYVLTVGAREPRKNLSVLDGAVAFLQRDRPDLELVAAGSGSGYVGDEELARLYRGAAAFAYPSRFEGFGMPIVEALASGVPAVVSSHPSMDEACGDVALRADPDSAEEFASALERALGAGPEVRERGIEHARQFTWESCGRAVLDGYLMRLQELDSR